MKMKRAFVLALAVSFAGCATRQIAPPSPAPAAAPPAAFEHLVPHLPGTPAGALNADVTQSTINSNICVTGWTTTVRPPTSYTNELKRKLMQEQSLPLAKIGLYELDHFVPLALGGHPKSPDNLWLQTWDGEWGAKTKDRLERKLQVMVCAHQITLDAARDAIRTNWIDAFKKYVHPTEPFAPAEAVD
jgi:hypothetical protein